jgi:hypothetical protein
MSGSAVPHLQTGYTPGLELVLSVGAVVPVILY